MKALAFKSVYETLKSELSDERYFLRTICYT